MFLLFIAFFSGDGQSAVFASTPKATDSSASASAKKSDLSDQTGFTVEAIQSDNQIDKDFSFFYVRTKPLEEQKLRVKVISKRKKASKVKITLTNAVTNITGQIDYGQEKAILDSSLKLPLTDFVTLGEEEITVANNEEKIVEITVKPPKASYKGVRLGAVMFTSLDASKKSSSGVKSTYGYKIAIMTSEDLLPYNEGARIDYIKVKPRLQNGQKVVAMTIRNPEPFVLENLAVETKLRKKGESKVLASNSLANMKFAPNSSFDFLTYLGMEDLAPGKYVINSVATDGNQEWVWEKEFTISRKQAEDVNKNAAYKLRLPSLYKILAGLLLLVSSVNVGYLFYRRRREN